MTEQPSTTTTKKKDAAAPPVTVLQQIKSMAGPLLMMSIFGVLVIVFGPRENRTQVPLKFLAKYRKSNTGIPTWARPIKDVSRVQWSEMQGHTDADGNLLSPADYVASLRKPVILVGSPSTTWSAMDKWNGTDGYAYLAEANPTLRNVRMQRDPLFLYEDHTRLMGKTDGLLPGPKLTNVDVDTREFLSQPKGKTKSKRKFSSREKLYYSHVLNSTAGFGAVDADASPRSFMRVSEVQDDQVELACEGEMGKTYGCATMWIGHPNIIAGTHFDPTHNFFAQVNGAKRFIVSSPASYRNVKLFPFYHPHDRQSQLEVGSDSHSLFGKKTFKMGPQDVDDSVEVDNNIDVAIADIYPGEMLYLPPYFFHRVAPLGKDISISVNLWSSSEEKALSDSFTDIPQTLERETEADLKFRGAAVAYFARSVLGELYMMSYIYNKGVDFSNYEEKRKRFTAVNSGVSKFITSVLEDRYMFPENPELGEQLLCEPFKKDQCPTDGHLPEAIQAELDVATASVEAKLFAFFTKASVENKNVANTDAVAKLIMTDFLERIVTFGLRDVRATCKFLRCLAERDTWARETKSASNAKAEL